jgi:hypothetical protein
MSEPDRAITADHTHGSIELIASPHPLPGHLGGRVIGAARTGEVIYKSAFELAL